MNYVLTRLKQNTGLKFLALFMSLVACLSVHVLTTPTRDDTISHRVYTLPIKFSEPGNDLIYSAEEKEVVVTVRGSMAVLNKITPELLSAEVDLSTRIQPGNAVESIQVRTPNGVSVTSVTPSFTWVRVSHRLVKSVPVRVSLQGQVKSGYSVGTPVAFPVNAQVSGAVDRVERVVELRAPVVVSNLSSNVSVVALTLLPIDRQGEKVEGVDVVNSDVSVNVPVYALTSASVKLDNLKITADKDVSYSLSVEPKNVLLEARGESSKTPKSIKVQPQVIKVRREPLTVTVPLLIPDGVALAQGVDKDVVISITPTPKPQAHQGSSRKANKAK